MKIGRNDPCHCGSGKKYKKCCLRTGEETRNVQRRAGGEPDSNGRDARDAPSHDSVGPASHAPDAAIRSPSPAERAAPGGWYDFKARDFEGRISLYEEILDNPELMDGEMALDMLGDLYPRTAREGQRARFDGLVANLRERRPEIYAEKSQYIIGWLVSNALVEQSPDRVAVLAGEMASLAGTDIDMWNRVEDQLAYHGELATLREAMHSAWPGVRDSAHIVPWGIEEFRQRALDYEFFHYADPGSAQESVSDLREQTLRAGFAYYLDAEPEASDLQHLAESYAHLAGRAGRQWTLDDFKLPPSSRSSIEQDEDAPEQSSSASRALYLLTLDFLGELHRSDGVAYTQGELGCRDLRRFVIERSDGRLEYRESMLDAALRDMGRRSPYQAKPKRRFRPYAHVLVPDRERFDYFLGDLMGMFAQLHHRVAALVRILPRWLEFLESRQLIDAGIHSRARKDLAAFREPLVKVFEGMEEDPSLRHAMEHWPPAQ